MLAGPLGFCLLRRVDRLQKGLDAPVPICLRVGSDSLDVLDRLIRGFEGADDRHI